MIKLILKRDGSLVPFELDKIAVAIDKAFQASDCIKNYDKQVPIQLANEVVKIIEARDVEVPTVEFVQDIVEEVLIEKNYIRSAKAYILYREKRSNQRKIAATLGSSFEQLESYQPKNGFYNSPKERSRILGEASLANYNQSNHFDCFVTKALEQKILSINNLAYLDDLIYQYVVDCAKIADENSDVSLNRFMQVVMYFDRYQQGPLRLGNFKTFLAQAKGDAGFLTELGLVFDSLEIFLENSLEIEAGDLEEAVCQSLVRPHITFESDFASANVVYNIAVDVALLEKKSPDLGIDLGGLEKRLKVFLNKSSRQLFTNSLKMLGSYRQYLASEATVNRLDLLNSSTSQSLQDGHLFEGLDDQLILNYK